MFEFKFGLNGPIIYWKFNYLENYRPALVDFELIDDSFPFRGDAPTIH
jgi:hypothetical protein